MYFGYADLILKLVYGDIISCSGCQKTSMAGNAL